MSKPYQFKTHCKCDSHSSKTTNITHRLRDRADRAWFSHLLRHPVRKWSGSILTTWSPHGADAAWTWEHWKCGTEKRKY